MKLFWSWQSDTPGKIGRHFIRDALDAAVAELKRDLTLDEPREREALNAMHIDQDRQGVPGSSDLFPEILKKIDASYIVVADVTAIGIIDPEVIDPKDPERAKRLINSNVAIELGYAYRARSNSFVLLVMNTHYGRHEDLPFDLRHKGGTIFFTLAPTADRAEIIRVGKILKGRFVDEIKLCLSAVAAEEDASAPVPGLLALGPDIICEGDILAFDQSEWKVHLRDFVVGDLRALVKFVEEFEQLDKSDRYVLLDVFGDGRRLTAAPSLEKVGNTYIARCPIAVSFPRTEADAMPSSFAESEEGNDLYLERGNIARVSGRKAVPQRIRSTLSLIRGESPFYLTYGSRLQEYYWKFRGGKLLERIFKLEVIRQAAIPYDDLAGEPEHTPFRCVERVQSIRILADSPLDGRLPLSLELDVKGLGRIEQKVSVIMPSEEKVSELSQKGAAMGLARRIVSPVHIKPTIKKPDIGSLRNLKRLSVVTKRWEPSGLELEIKYQPESQHIGLSARVSLLSPQGGVLKAGIPTRSKPGMGTYVWYQPGGAFVDACGTLRLNIDLQVSKTTVKGVVFVAPSETATQPLPMAKVRIEIITDAEEMLLSHELSVSPLR